MAGLKVIAEVCVCVCVRAGGGVFVLALPHRGAVRLKLRNIKLPVISWALLLPDKDGC